MRIGKGNLSNVRSVGESVLEYKLDFGPGYRLYFGRPPHAAATASSLSVTGPVPLKRSRYR